MIRDSGTAALRPSTAAALRSSTTAALCSSTTGRARHGTAVHRSTVPQYCCAPQCSTTILLYTAVQYHSTALVHHTSRCTAVPYRVQFPSAIVAPTADNLGRHPRAHERVRARSHARTADNLGRHECTHEHACAHAHARTHARMHAWQTTWADMNGDGRMDLCCESENPNGKWHVHLSDHQRNAGHYLEPQEYAAGHSTIGPNIRLPLLHDTGRCWVQWRGMVPGRVGYYSSLTDDPYGPDSSGRHY